MEQEKKDKTGQKVVFSVIIVLIAAMLENKVLGPEENWGTSYEDLGRAITGLIVMGGGGLILWLLWRKKAS